MPATDKKILLLGSGYVAGPCAAYLARRPENKLTIASRSLANAQALAARFPGSAAVSFDINNTAAFEELVGAHDVVISLIPYTQHALVIRAAINKRKHVVTTSYVSDAMMALDADAKAAGITVMNEIGLDPGIDHLYAVKTIDEVHAAGGKMLAFTSYCGGLPAPENADNPLGYKFSWSARGVLLAALNGARYLEHGAAREVAPGTLMQSTTEIPIDPRFSFVGYPNRDSTAYGERYRIPEAHTVLRGTLRFAGFPPIVEAFAQLGLLDLAEDPSLAPGAAPLVWRQLLARKLPSASESSDLQAAVAGFLAGKPAIGTDVAAVWSGLEWLGLTGDQPVAQRGTALDALCAVVEKKLTYADGERDMVVLQHRFEIELADGTPQTRTSTLIEYGVPGGDSAMARTVGVPCGIATQLVLDGVLNKPGVLAPMSADINDPIIKLLEAEGITMVEAIL